jgi:hypothetical protein
VVYVSGIHAIPASPSSLIGKVERIPSQSECAPDKSNPESAKGPNVLVLSLPSLELLDDNVMLDALCGLRAS